MRSVIRINEKTSVDDVLEWVLDQEVRFVISKASSFLPGTQGIAMSALKSAVTHRAKISVTCEFHEPISTDDAENSPLGTPFGFSLARLATSIDFLPRLTPISGQIKRNLGRLYVQQKGRLGIGKQSSLVAIDPRFPFPPALKEDVQAGDTDFPAPSRFQSVLADIAASLGFSRALTSSFESDLVAYIYELARNSWEHGIPVSSIPSASTRAIILEKIVIQANDRFERYPTFLQEYLQRIRTESGADLGIGVLCITVVDQGEGIQGTLPAVENESESDRLERAFGEGESRKAKGAISRGMGLSKALSAAFHLRAMLQVCSGGLLGIQDFSTGEYKYPGIALKVTRLPVHLSFGTSISLFVPESSRSLDQPALFEG